MLFKTRFLIGIRQSNIKLAFRRWKRPTVKQGGTLMTAIGQLQIGAITKVNLDSISTSESTQAGYDSLDELHAELTRRNEGDIYRIEIGPLIPDPRVKLREAPASKGELEASSKKLQRLNWPVPVLEVIKENPNVRAGDLCVLVGLEKMQFKANVRKLKNLGLTESLATGYRLSPRGIALLNHLDSASKDQS